MPEAIWYVCYKPAAGLTKGGDSDTKTIHLAFDGCGGRTCCTRRGWCISRTTRCNGRRAVTHWNQIAANTLAAFPPPAGGAAPTVQINLGMVQGAVYDAVNAITPKHLPAISSEEAILR